MYEGNRSEDVYGRSTLGNSFVPNLMIGSTNARIDESTGKRKFCITMNEEHVFPYEKKMLQEGGCPYVLPMVFLHEADALKAYYDFTGFIRIEDDIEMKKQSKHMEQDTRGLLCDSLELLMKVLNCIKGMENYMLNPHRFQIKTDVIFIRKESGDVVIAFYPDEISEISLQDKILELVGTLEKLYQNSEIEQYLEKFVVMVQIKNPGLDAMIGMLGIMQREASYIYYNIKNFRDSEAKEPTREENISMKINLEPVASDGRDFVKNRFPIKKNEDGRTVLNTKQTILIKLLGTHAILLIMLIIAWLSRLFEVSDLFGIAIIVIAADFWVMNKMKLFETYQTIKS